MNYPKLKEKRKMAEEKNTKKRYWTFVLYPESAPEDWCDRIQLTGVLACISPLHDKDTNPTGEPKKPHHHIALAYPGPTTYNAVAKFTASLNATIPQPLESIVGMYRYFTHRDNPEKAQYNEADIKNLNGFDIGDYIEFSRREVLEFKIKIQRLIIEADIREYASLMELLLDNEMLTEYEIAAGNTYFFDRYIASRRHTIL